MEEKEPITQEELSEDLEGLFANTLRKRNANCTYKFDLGHEITTRFRYLKRQISALMREKFKSKFKQILYITINDIPYDYISAFRQQYPDKELKVVIPIIGEPKRLTKTPIKFKYYLQNKKNHATVYKLPFTKENIIVYGIYSEAFSDIDSEELFKDIKYLSPYMKCVRILGKILRPDIIHSDIVPFHLGTEFESKSKYPVKVFQTIQDFSLSELNFEPFWAVLNMADKPAMKKLCRDKIIKKCIASLFNQDETNNFRQMRECLEFIYLNYIAFRSKIDKSEDFAENTLFERLNERALKMFPQIAIPESKVYNPLYEGIKRSDYWAVLSETYYKELLNQTETNSTLAQRIEETKSNSGFVHKVFVQNKEKIHRSFNLENFRDRRYKNKEYLLRELSKDRIKMDFVDKTFFEGEYKIHGYLDSFYEAPLFFGNFSTKILDDGFDIAVSAILKLFELSKNIQVILNIPQGMENNYIRSFVEFCE